MQGGEDVWTTNVLNLGVRPDKLIETVKQRFEAAGGVVIDEQAAQGAVVHPDGVSLTLPGDESAERTQATCRLLLDCMGHASPIVRQVRCASPTAHDIALSLPSQSAALPQQVCCGALCRRRQSMGSPA